MKYLETHTQPCACVFCRDEIRRNDYLISAEARLKAFADLVWDARWPDSSQHDYLFGIAAEIRSGNFESIDKHALGAGTDQGHPTHEGDSAGLAPLKPSCSGSRITLENIKQFPHLKCPLMGKSVRIWSGQWKLWWREEGAGYTHDESKAWVTTFESAYAVSKHAGPEKKIEYCEVPTLDEKKLARLIMNDHTFSEVHQDCEREKEIETQSQFRLELETLRKDNARYLSAFRHRHVNNGHNQDDSCAKCGLDLRDEIHFSKEKQKL